MSSKIECKSRTLFIRTEMHLQARLLKPCTLLGPHRKGACQVRLTLTLVLYSARIKHICEVRLTTNFVLHSARAQNAHAEERCLQVSYSIRHVWKTHMPSEFDCNIRTLFGTHKTQMLSEIDYNTRTLFGMHKNAQVKEDYLKSCT